MFRIRKNMSESFVSLSSVNQLKLLALASNYFYGAISELCTVFSAQEPPRPYDQTERYRPQRVPENAGHYLPAQWFRCVEISPNVQPVHKFLYVCQLVLQSTLIPGKHFPTFKIQQNSNMKNLLLKIKTCLKFKNFKIFFLH